MSKKPPPPGAPPEVWEDYALAVDGYDLAGGNEPAEDLYAAARKEVLDTGAIAGDHTHLRIALFMHQRHCSWTQPSAEEQAEEQRIADIILTALQQTPR